MAEATKANEFTDRIRELELALTATQAKIDAQQGFANELRTYFDARGGSIEDSAGKLNLTRSG